MSITTNVPRNTVLKRYISLEKFEKLLTDKALYFARFDRFEDRLEGGINQKNFPSISNSWGILDRAINGCWPSVESQSDESTSKGEMLSETFSSLFGEQKKINGEAYLQNVSSWLYASCWTDLRHECQAMWQLYGSSGACCRHEAPCTKCQASVGMSLCIETTLGSLIDNLVLDEGYNAIARKIEYLDHRNAVFLEHEMAVRPFFAKALHFSYEHELRLMLWPKRKDIDFSYIHNASTINERQSVSLPLENLDSLIHKIILSPISYATQKQLSDNHFSKYKTALGLPEALANENLRQRVSALCQEFGVSAEIVDSDLNQISASDCYSAWSEMAK